MTKNVIQYPPEVVKILQKFEPYFYQRELIDAIEKKGYKKIMSIIPRRAGKDLGCFNIIVRQALMRRGNYLYMLPTHKQARKVIYSGLTFDGTPFLDYIPPQLIDKRLDNEMFIRLVNGSQLYFCGSNSFDSYRGISPMGVVISESAYSHSQAYPTISPALLFNNGWVIHISTPNGYNHFEELYRAAVKSPDWFVQYLSYTDTKHITKEEIEREIKDGSISSHMAPQEYECRWDVGAVGSYYSRYVNELELDEKITDVPYDKQHPVYTSWDIGIDNHTAIIWFQLISNTIHIIDFHMENNQSLEYHIKLVLEKPYLYADRGHIWPHDGEHRDKMTAEKLSQMALRLGLKTRQAERVGFFAGIEKVRTMFNRFRIDENKCGTLIKHMRDYHRKYNTETGKYDERPAKDASTDACDALRYLCVTADYLGHGAMTREDAQRIRNKAIYGNQVKFPKQLRGESGRW